MVRVLVATVFMLLALGLPVLAQDETDAEQAKRIEELIEELGEAHPNRRSCAAAALAGIGPPAASAVPALIEVLESDRSESARCWAASALGKIHSGVAEVGLALLASLADPSENVRGWAACSLGDLGSPTPAAVSALIKTALGDENEWVRRQADSALSNLAANLVVPALAAVLSDQDNASAARCGAAGRLGDFGPRAASAVPALITTLSDKDEMVRYSGALALGDIGPKAAPAVPALITALSDENRLFRLAAAHALGEIGSSAAPGVPSLISGEALLTQHGNAATSALRKIGADLKAQGTLLWWAVPYAYWKAIAGLLALFVAWFALMTRFPRHRPTSTPKHLALMALTAAVPVALACTAVHHAVTRAWAQGFLPDAVTLVPFPVAAVLSTALVCVLPAIWVCQRKQPAASLASAG